MGCLKKRGSVSQKAGMLGAYDAPVWMRWAMVKLAMCSCPALSSGANKLADARVAIVSVSPGARCIRHAWHSERAHICISNHTVAEREDSSGVHLVVLVPHDAHAWPAVIAPEVQALSLPEGPTWFWAVCVLVAEKELRGWGQRVACAITAGCVHSLWLSCYIKG